MYVPALLAVMLAASLAAADPSAAPSGTPSPATAAPVVVHIKNFVYVPAKVHVTAGQTIRFVNDDDMAHTVTADDKSYDSSDLPTGKSWSHVFVKAGTATYYCYYHPFMKGSIEVTAP